MTVLRLYFSFFFLSSEIRFPLYYYLLNDLYFVDSFASISLSSKSLTTSAVAALWKRNRLFCLHRFDCCGRFTHWSDELKDSSELLNKRGKCLAIRSQGFEFSSFMQKVQIRGLMSRIHVLQCLSVECVHSTCDIQRFATYSM